MSATPQDPRELSPQEMAQALEWIDGELSTEAALEFELRLAADASLAAQVEGLALLDLHLRREARARVHVERTRRRWSIGVALAAAAVLAIALLPKLLAPRAPDFEVALAPSFALAEDWIGAQPELRGSSAPGIGSVRGGNANQRSAAEFLRASEISELSVSSNALETGRRELEAGWFVVPIDLEAPAAVIVLACGEQAPATRLFPTQADPGQAASAARLESGRQLLPSPRVIAGRQPQTLAYQPGFLVPLNVGSLTLLVAVRRQVPEPAWFQALEAHMLAGATADQLGERLAREGFVVQRLLVREPQ